MRRMLAIVALLFLLANITSPVAAEPLGQNSGVLLPPSSVVRVSLPADNHMTREPSQAAGKFDYLILRRPAPMSKPVLLAGRSNPTPYCCGTGPANYYCAKNVNGCTR